MKKSQKILAERIKMFRLNRHLTQDALAAKCAVTCRTISNAERAKVVPALEVLWALADFFQVSMDDLLGRTIPGTESRAVEEIQIDARIRQYDQKTLKHLSAYMDLLEQYV